MICRVMHAEKLSAVNMKTTLPGLILSLQDTAKPCLLQCFVDAEVLTESGLVRLLMLLLKKVYISLGINYSFFELHLPSVFI